MTTMDRRERTWMQETTVALASALGALVIAESFSNDRARGSYRLWREALEDVAGDLDAALERTDLVLVERPARQEATA